MIVLGPSGTFNLNPSPYICACNDSVEFNVCTIKATNLALLSGCSLFTLFYNFNPVGTESNPQCISTKLPYCYVDSCLPQVVLGDASGCQVYIDSAYLYIDSPSVQFTFNNYGVCVNGTVCFQDMTTYSLPSTHSYTVKRYWDFGDGSPIDSSQNPAPCHYYANVGGYNVKLYIESNHGCIDSSVGVIVVIPEYPIAGFYAQDSIVCQNTPICFYDTSWIYPLTGADYWIWYWGDGQIDTVKGIPFACHTYDTGGYYRVTMCVFDSVGCPDCDSNVVIRVIDNPVANAGGDKFVCCGVTTTLIGSGGVTYQWEPAGLFSDPSIPNPSVTICYDTLIALYVGDQYGCRDTDYAYLTHSLIDAAFNTGVNYCLDDSVCVVDASTNVNGTTVGWLYDFGDNTTYNTAYACHYYSAPGTNYTIKLIAVNNNGCIDSAFRTVNILPSPNAVFTLSESEICSYEGVCVTSQSTSAVNITSTVFNFGDGFTATGTGPICHTYNPPYLPTYTISLTVTDQNGCFDTTTLSLTLHEAPTANFNVKTGCEIEPVPFNNISLPGDAQIVSCQWTFWLGAPNPVFDNNCNTSFQFPPGNYSVLLVVTDQNNCSDSIVKSFNIDAQTELYINPGDTTICLGETLTYTVAGVYDNLTWTPTTWIDNPNSGTVNITPLASIGYNITATNGVCPADTSTFSVFVIQPIPFDVSAAPDKIVLGLTSNITSQIPAQIDSIIWSPYNTLDCRDCPNPIAQPTQTTTYTATVYYSRNGVTCTQVDSVTITVLGRCEESVIFLPNTFTPNGDGLNDIFMIRGLAAVKINYFRIYDRWGKLVFEAVDGVPNETKWGWDGTSRSGEQLNPAVFVYTYEIECINGDTVSGKGNVTLIR
ncbi:MAG: PKD domain-containing protein [Chitinophagales bacterium]|nr:PKD domain-containing protein [Chitinophagales bacterium]